MKWFLKALALVSLIAAELPEMVADGKITLSEGIRLVQKISAQLGFDFDTEGVDLDTLL